MLKQPIYIVLVMCAAVLLLGYTACKKSSETGKMLMDEDPPAASQSKVISESKEPVPLPGEPFPRAKIEQPVPSAMLEDLDVEIHKEKYVLQIKARQDKLVPLPDEPQPAQKAK